MYHTPCPNPQPSDTYYYLCLAHSDPNHCPRLAYGDPNTTNTAPHNGWRHCDYCGWQVLPDGPRLRDGLRDEARFCKPCGLGVDAQGNLLVADCFNHCIRRASPEGMVATVAGVCGDRAEYLDGPAAQARFFWPTHAIADLAGNIYVADSWNNRIRAIAPDGMVSTLAGGDVGYRDGPGHLARFGRPNGLVLDAEGNILFADLDNNVTTVTIFKGAENRLRFGERAT